MLGLDSPDSGKIKKEKKLTIGYLQQEIITGSEKSILEEVLASIPELEDLGEKIFILSNELSKSPDNIDTTKGQNYFYNVAEDLICEKNPDLFNQAIIEYGAMVCKPKNPTCTTCIFNHHCEAYKKNKVF